MFTLYNSTGEVFRDSDNKLVAPCDSTDDLDYISYIEWINDGNQPAVGTISPTEKQKLQDAAWEKIKIERDRRKMECGYKVTTGGIDYWYHSDDTSRIQQIALVMLGTNMPNGIMWKTMSAEFVAMSPTLAQQVFQAAITSDMTLFTVAEQKRNAMQTLPDPRTYDFKSGWPKGYGE